MSPSDNLPAKQSSSPNFWMTAIGGFVLGALAVIIVLLLARRTGDKEAPTPPTPDAPAQILPNEPPTAASK